MRLVYIESEKNVLMSLRAKRSNLFIA